MVRENKGMMFRRFFADTITTSNNDEEEAAGGKMPATSSHPLIYVVMNCDDTCSPNSRTLAMTATRASHVKLFVERGLQTGRYSYKRGKHCRSIGSQLHAFRKDWDGHMPRKQMNQYLRGCFLDTMIAGRQYLPPEFREKRTKENNKK